ncbi:metal ABC transporter ATP-binding protein [uncultured Corynebacterium sp.]|uniref:metal ABC transporter ATP-binding protein n=1 Tax=uncultured Corynebacterium sp. TaxID=159447 RepID=UPI0025CF5822|nr:metal ABC transporter ATP-binding protein [uncultured Corynebacterium sp.]
MQPSNHTASAQVAIQVDGVTVSYQGGTNPSENALALDRATTAVHYGHVKALIGPNGSGKSTLFKAMMGLVPLLHGTITRHDESPGAIAYVPQHESVDWNFPISVEDVVASGRYAHPTRRGLFGGRWLGRHTGEDKAAIEDALRIADLEGLRNRQIGQLSGGQRKRVFVARGIAQGAGTLLLDEPFAGVDNTSRDGLTTLFTSLATQGKALLVATHDIGHLPTFCDEVVMLNRRVVADGPSDVTLTDDNLLATFSGVQRGVGPKEYDLQNKPRKPGGARDGDEHSFRN